MTVLFWGIISATLSLLLIALVVKRASRHGQPIGPGEDEWRRGDDSIMSILAFLGLDSNSDCAPAHHHTSHTHCDTGHGFDGGQTGGDGEGVHFDAGAGHSGGHG